LRGCGCGDLGCGKLSCLYNCSDHFKHVYGPIQAILAKLEHVQYSTILGRVEVAIIRDCDELGSGNGNVDEMLMSVLMSISMILAYKQKNKQR
jgi:hypothetical protein